MMSSICRQTNLISLQLIFLKKRSYWNASRSARDRRNKERLAGQGAAFQAACGFHRRSRDRLLSRKKPVANRPAGYQPAPQLHRSFFNRPLSSLEFWAADNQTGDLGCLSIRGNQVVRFGEQYRLGDRFGTAHLFEARGIDFEPR